MLVLFLLILKNKRAVIFTNKMSLFRNSREITMQDMNTMQTIGRWTRERNVTSEKTQGGRRCFEGKSVAGKPGCGLSLGGRNPTPLGRTGKRSWGWGLPLLNSPSLELHSKWGFRLLIFIPLKGRTPWWWRIWWESAGNLERVNRSHRCPAFSISGWTGHHPRTAPSLSYSLSPSHSPSSTSLVPQP